jgi:snRNA-activating protein complex subunit 3
MGPDSVQFRHSEGPLSAPSLLPGASIDAIALLTFSIHTPLPYARTTSRRTSQHALTSSQTLFDLFRVMPCPSRDMTNPGEEGSGHTSGYQEHDETETRSEKERHAFVIEDNVHGDGFEGDYAKFVYFVGHRARLIYYFISSKLVSHLNSGGNARHPSLRKVSTTTRMTRLDTLIVKLHEPYWLLHEGNCEHFVVIDEIRCASSRVAREPLVLRNVAARTGCCILQTHPCLPSL